MTSSPSLWPVRPSPRRRAPVVTPEMRERWAVQAEEATIDALKTIAMNFPALGRRRLGIRYGRAYCEAMIRLRQAGLIQAYAKGELPRWHKHATPRQILALCSPAAKVKGAE